MLKNIDKQKIMPWLWVPVLYFAEGLPNELVTKLSKALFQQEHISVELITFIPSTLALIWVFKVFWSPFIDVIKSKRWWILTMEYCMAGSTILLAFLTQTQYWFEGIIVLFASTALFSATHDIAADGFYMLGLSEKQQSQFVGIRSLFFRLALVAEGFFLACVGNLQVITKNIRESWSLVFYLIGGIFLVISLINTKYLPKPKEDFGLEKPSIRTLITEFKDALYYLIHKFPAKEALCSILFIMFFRLSESLLGGVSDIFFRASASEGGLGLSLQEQGFIQGTLGVIGMLVGGILGGILASKYGLKKCLWPMVIAITVPDALYILLSYTQTTNWWIIVPCVCIEQFGYGFGYTLPMMFFLYLSKGKYSTTVFAVCAALMYLFYILPQMAAGALLASVGYYWYFIIVVILCPITFLVSALVKFDPEFGKKND